MKRVGSRELKNRLGAYLKRVRRGEKLIVTDRGEPVAQLSPIDPGPAKQRPIDDILNELEARGILRLAKKPLQPFKAVPGRGKSASEMIIEDRS